MNLGDYNAGDLLDLKFTTRDATGLPTVLSGSPVVSCYKNNDVAQATTGVALTVSFDSVVGLNHLRVTTSADATFYADGNEYDLVLTAGTVGGTSVVGEVIARFTLGLTAPTRPLCRGVVTTGATTTLVPTSALYPAASDPDQFKGRVLIFDHDTATAGLRGQGAPVASSSALGVLTIAPGDALSRAPASGDRFGIY